MSGIYLIARCAHPLCARGQFHSKNTKSPHPHPHPGGEGASPKAERSNGPPGFAPNPVGLGRGAQVSADQGWHMSERSELCQTPLKSSTAGCPVAQRRGPRLRVAFLLGTFLWRSKEQVPRLPGRDPAPTLSNAQKYPNHSTRKMRFGLNPKSAAFPFRARAPRALFRLRISSVSSRSLPPRPIPSIFTLRV